MALFSFPIHLFSVLLLFLVTEITPANTTNTTLSPIVVPAPPGPYLTSYELQVMVDTSRPDPYNSSESSRRLLSTVFTPILESECIQTCNVQYVPPVAAANLDKAIGSSVPIFRRLELSGICCNVSSAVGQSTSPGCHVPPLVIWSPGFGESRLQWTISAQYLASYGYKVVLVDHPGDAPITEFPDGEVVKGIYRANESEAVRVPALNIETQDLLFVISSFSGDTWGANRGNGSERKVGIVAHGTPPAQAMLNDSLNGYPGRIVGGVNLDGRFEGPVLTEGIGAGQKSFLIWVPSTGPNNQTSWDVWWNITDKLEPGDWRKELSIANSTQGTFSDYPLLADISGFRKIEPKVVNSTLGTISGARMMTIQTTYLTAFFDMTIKGKTEPLLNGPNQTFPEVGFVKSST